jgi:ribosomal protein S18 acetylase RimI-like enzyme
MNHFSSGDEPIIRHAVEADIPYLLSESDAVYMQFLFQSAYQGMMRGEQLMWVVERYRAIIGQVFVQYSSMRPQLANGIDRAYFYSFRVAPEYRNQGVGSNLLCAMEDDLQKRGFTHVTLTVAKANDRAIQLYARQGYHIVGSEIVQRNAQKVKDRWERVEEEAWRMEKRLK